MREFILLFGNIGIENIIFIVLILLIAFLLFGDMLKKSSTLKLAKPLIKTELVCTSCGLKVIRDFKEGDYISKEDDNKCKKCGGTLKIEKIYMIETKKTK